VIDQVMNDFHREYQSVPIFKRETGFEKVVISLNTFEQNKFMVRCFVEGRIDFAYNAKSEIVPMDVRYTGYTQYESGSDLVRNKTKFYKD
jgi:hypothetical protein